MEDKDLMLPLEPESEEILPDPVSVEEEQMEAPHRE